MPAPSVKFGECLAARVGNPAESVAVAQEYGLGVDLDERNLFARLELDFAIFGFQRFCIRGVVGVEADEADHRRGFAGGFF